jgi:hypothetical protein
VFTRLLPTTLSFVAKQYMKASGFSTILSFEKHKNKEDLEALDYMGVTYISPHLIDAAFRTKNNEPIYSTFTKIFSGIISPYDNSLRKNLTLYLSKKEKNYDLIISPVGIGGHVDHNLTRAVATALIDKTRLAFYLDVPYYFTIKNWSQRYLQEYITLKKSHTLTTDFKRACLQYYKSQLALLFRNNTTLFFNKRHMLFPEIILHDTQANIL